MTERTNCPFCGFDLTAPDPVPDQTGEFDVGIEGLDAVKTNIMSRRAVAAIPTGAEAAGADGPTCTWCGSSEGEVRRLLSGRGAYICDGCVALCYEVLKDSLTDWPGSAAK